MGMCREHAFHQRGQVFGFRRHKMHSLVLPGNGFADVVLGGSIVVVPKPFVHDLVLQFDQRGLAEEILFLRRLEKRHESFGARRCRLDVFDFK